MNNAFTAPHFQAPELAREWLEGQRWPEGPICSHCGTINHAYKTKKPGRYRCASKECRKDFTVTTGTLMERSHIALNKWLMAFYLMASSKKGISSHQPRFECRLQVGLVHDAPDQGIYAGRRPWSVGRPYGSGIVEADETYYGPTEERRVSSQRRGRPYTKKGKTGPGGKRAIVALVERGGNIRSFHVAVAGKETVSRIIKENIAKEARLFTDESRLYGAAKGHFADHQTVKQFYGRVRPR